VALIRTDVSEVLEVLFRAVLCSIIILLDYSESYVIIVMSLIVIKYCYFVFLFFCRRFCGDFYDL
jgi:hypothetical protein